MVSLRRFFCAIKEDLKDLVDHVELLVLLDVQSSRGLVAGAKHFIQVEGKTVVFEFLRPIRVVAIFWRIYAHHVHKVASLSSQHALHADITIEGSHDLPRFRGFLLLASITALTVFVLQDFRTELTSGTTGALSQR